MKKKYYIVSWHDLSRAYSCLLYLRDELAKDSDVFMWSKTDMSNMPYVSENMHSFFNQWYGKIPKIRNVFAQIHMFFLAIKSKGAVFIINDWDFLIPLYYATKINKEIKVVHYNTEIPGADVHAMGFMEKFYVKHADYPDAIIECMRERADWRLQKYGITKKIYVIENTIPNSYIPKCERNDYKEITFEKEQPIVIYSGKASFSRQLEEILKCVQIFRDKLNFTFFCYGEKRELSKLAEYLDKYCTGKNYILNNAIPRMELHQVMQCCDIGINYYQPDFSINHKYAAPTKFFEYMACGLNIVSTNNEGINHIIEENGIGVCIREGKELSDALGMLLEKGLKSHEYIKTLFREKYCYEEKSKEAINVIKAI